MARGYTLHQQRAMVQHYWRDGSLCCAECGASMLVHPISVPAQAADVVAATCPRCGREFRGHGPTGGDAVWPQPFVASLLRAAASGAAPRCPNDEALLQVRRITGATETLLVFRCPNCGQRAGHTLQPA